MNEVICIKASRLVHGWNNTSEVISYVRCLFNGEDHSKHQNTRTFSETIWKRPSVDALHSCFFHTDVILAVRALMNWQTDGNYRHTHTHTHTHRHTGLIVLPRPLTREVIIISCIETIRQNVLFISEVTTPHTKDTLTWTKHWTSCGSAGRWLIWWSAYCSFERADVFSFIEDNKQIQTHQTHI